MNESQSIRINPALHYKAKLEAVRVRKSLKEYVEDALLTKLERKM